MYIPYGDKIVNVDNTYIFRIGKIVGHGTPKYVYAEYVYNGKTQHAGQYKIVYINEEKHLIICDCGDTFKYYDNCYYVELCKPTEI